MKGSDYMGMLLRRHYEKPKEEVKEPVVKEEKQKKPTKKKVG